MMNDEMKIALLSTATPLALGIAFTAALILPLSLGGTTADETSDCAVTTIATQRESCEAVRCEALGNPAP
jgi:hypothetical protein